MWWKYFCSFFFVLLYNTKFMTGFNLTFFKSKNKIRSQTVHIHYNLQNHPHCPLRGGSSKQKKRVLCWSIIYHEFMSVIRYRRSRTVCAWSVSSCKVTIYRSILETADIIHSLAKVLQFCTVCSQTFGYIRIFDDKHVWYFRNVSQHGK